MEIGGVIIGKKRTVEITRVAREVGDCREIGGIVIGKQRDIVIACIARELCHG